MLNKKSAIPLYNQLVTLLIDYIKTSLTENEKMLSEREICDKYNVSRTTVRAALSELEETGFIYKRHGKGTFVSGLWKEMKNLSNAFSFTEQMKQLGKSPHTDILSFEKVKAIPYIAENLQISTNDEVYKLKRLRSADNMKMLYETSFIPANLFPNLTVELLETMPLYDLFSDKYQQEIKYADEEFFASLTQEKEAKRLDVPYGSACLRIFRTTYNNDNKIIEYTISVARGDQFIYKIQHFNKRLGGN